MQRSAAAPRFVCVQEEGDTIGEGVGSRLCKYCVDGLTAAEAILGCRQSHGRREYYLKFKDASYRCILWTWEGRCVCRLLWV